MDEVDEDIELRQRLEEAEVARLAQDRGFGLGGLVDKLIGWTLFDVRDDEVQDSIEEEHAEDGQDLSRSTSASAREQTAHISPAELPGVKTGESGGAEQCQEAGEANLAEDEGGWKDAAWLLSVASKVLL